MIAGIDGSDAPVVVDCKTAKRAKTENDLANDLQMAIYAWALGIDRVAFVTLCKTKTPKVEIVEGLIAAIRAGVFPPTDPTAWVCSPKFCGFWDRYRGCAGQA